MRDNRLVFIVTDKTGTQLIEVKAARNDARIPWDFLRDALALKHVNPPGKPLWICHEDVRVQIIALYSVALLAMWMTWAQEEIDNARNFSLMLMEGYRSPRCWLQMMMEGNNKIDGELAWRSPVQRMVTDGRA